MDVKIVEVSYSNKRQEKYLQLEHFSKELKVGFSYSIRQQENRSILISRSELLSSYLFVVCIYLVKKKCNTPSLVI